MNCETKTQFDSEAEAEEAKSRVKALIPQGNYRSQKIPKRHPHRQIKSSQ